MASAQNLPRYSLIINGEVCEPAGGEYEPVIDPATGNNIAQVAVGSEADLNQAVAAAKTAFENPEWRDMEPEERARVLYKCARLLKVHALELLGLEMSASGGTFNRIARMDLPAAIDMFRVLAEEVKTFPFVESMPPRSVPENVHTQIWKEPIGVCGLITPWNFPLLLLAMKLTPALAAGNTIVIKPAEITPTSTIRLVEILQQALPKGVLNVVPGHGPVVGEAMSLHKDIDKISFTGSTNVGKQIQVNAAASLKRVTLELGGKAPAIVMPDADLDLMAHGALWGVFMNSGQACESGTRLLVHESIYEQTLDKLKAVSEKIVVGNPADPATGMGPMSSESHFNKVMGFIDSAKADGARIVCGGEREMVEGCEGGFFVQPTVVADVTNDMKVAREEIFGPVLAVIKYSTTEEAINIANDTDYGLSAGLWTDDLIKAQKIARELRAGSVWINDWHMMRTDTPFGGFKQSGYGREFGRASLEAYVETKAVATAFQRLPEKKSLHKIVHTTLA